MTITSLSLDCRVYTQKVIVTKILGYILKIFSVYTQNVIVGNILGNILNIFSVCTEKVIVSNILGYILDTNLLNGFFSCLWSETNSNCTVELS